MSVFVWVSTDDLRCSGNSSTVCMTQIGGFMLSTRLQMVTGEASASLHFPSMTLFCFSFSLFLNNHCSSALTFCIYLVCFVIVIHRHTPFWAKLSKDKIALWQSWNVYHSLSKMSTQDTMEEVLYGWQWICISISKSVFNFRAVASLTKGGTLCFQSWNNKRRKQN